MIPPATQWIKKNMMNDYSEELGRPLTDAEVRVKRSLEQLQVPDWYKKYSKPTKFLKSSAPIDRRPPTWKTFKQKHACVTNTPKKTPRKCTPKKTPRKVVQLLIQPVQNAVPLAPTPTKPTICGVQPKPDYDNEKYRIRRKSSPKRKSPSISITTSSSETECDHSLQMMSTDLHTDKTTVANSWHTFPRMSPSRKIQNINIVFDKPFLGSELPVPPPLPKSAPPKKTIYTLTKRIDLEASDVDPDVSCNGGKLNKSHTSFMFADVEPIGYVSNQVHGFAGLDSSYDIEDNNNNEEKMILPPRSSPHTRFFNSSKKSRELEKIVQTELSQSKLDKNRSLIQDIIEELDRSVAEGRSFLSASDAAAAQQQGDGGDGFVKSMIQALEESYRSSVIEDRCDDDEEKLLVSDSELAKSTTISIYENSSDESTLPGRFCCVSSGTEEENYEEEAFWIPVKTPSANKNKRSSSRSSVLSRKSNKSARSVRHRQQYKSPVMSPIKENLKQTLEQRYWSAASSYQKRGRRITSRRLFKIDELGVADSGYTTTTNSASSRTCTKSSSDGRYSAAITSSSSGASSGSSSLSTSPDLLMECDKMTSQAVFARSSDAFMLKSILV